MNTRADALVQCVPVLVAEKLPLTGTYMTVEASTVVLAEGVFLRSKPFMGYVLFISRRALVPQRPVEAVRKASPRSVPRKFSLTTLHFRQFGPRLVRPAWLLQ